MLIRQIREAIAEDNREEIIERLLKGRQERIRKGHSPGGNVPYGYRRERKTLVPHHPEATVVRKILEARQVGHSTPAIADHLNGQRLTRRNGKPWTSRGVRPVLSQRELNEKGKLHYGRVEGGNEELILAQQVALPHPACVQDSNAAINFGSW